VRPSWRAVSAGSYDREKINVEKAKKNKGQPSGAGLIFTKN